MHRYVIKRLLMMIPVIIGVSFLVFFIMDMAPGDAVDLMAPEGATAQDLAAIRHDLGLDKPVVLRYIDYMLGMLQGDMGVSYVSKTDVFYIYAKTSGNTDTFLCIHFCFYYFISAAWNLFSDKTGKCSG